jgi:hypothetical protein
MGKTGNPPMNSPSNENRRLLLKRGIGAGAAFGLSSLIADGPALAVTDDGDGAAPGRITAGDLAILNFLAAAELFETDLWQQYSELAQGNPAFREALQATDPSVVQYIIDTERDEKSHATFINAFLASIGQPPVNLDAFRTLPSPNVTGLQQVGRLTNLTSLTIDTSWYTRYRSTANPDFDDTPPQLVKIVQRPTIPTSDTLKAADIQAIADTANFHFCAIEQGGSSLYTSFYPKVSNLDVLRLVTGIGPVEAIHFGVFQTSLEGLRGLTSTDGELVFPDLRNNKMMSQSVMPAPATFLDSDLPLNSVVRPGGTKQAGAVAAATGLVNSGLFQGQPPEFFQTVVGLAKAADAARRRR